MSQTRYYSTRDGQQRPYNGPGPGVAPGANYGIKGSAYPDQWNNQDKYPPNQAESGPTSILPAWMHAAVGEFKRWMRPATWPTPKNARQQINQGFASNAVNLPTSQDIPYRSSPMQYNRYIAGTQTPDYGGSLNVMYSTPSRSMDDQPAFEIDPPIGQGRSVTHLYEGLNWFSPMRSGLPTFFPVGNRSQQSNTGPGVDSHPVGVSYLVVPPDRYRRPNRAQPVRGKTGASRGNFSRYGTPPLYFGS